MFSLPLSESLSHCFFLPNFHRQSTLKFEFNRPICNKFTGPRRCCHLRFRLPYRESKKNAWPAAIFNLFFLEAESMSLSSQEIRELCTKQELSLVLASQLPALEKLSSTELKKHAVNARKLVDKWQDLSRAQARTEGRTSGSPNLDGRTHAKHDLFRAALEAFEARLNSTAAKPPMLASKRPVKSTVRAAEAKATRQSTRKQLHATKKKINAASAAIPAASVPAVTVTAAKITPKKVKPKASATKKVSTKAFATKQALVKTASARAAKRTTVSVATPLKSATKKKTISQVAPGTAAQRVTLGGKAKANRVAISNNSKIVGHVSSKGKRTQAKRDSKGR